MCKSDAGICHTFNGLDIENIFKVSTWRNSFGKSFKGFGNGNSGIKMSEGIEKEHGFVFTIGKKQWN